MEPDNYAVHCDCQFASLDEVRAAVTFWFQTLREVIEILPEGQGPWHCSWSSAHGPNPHDAETLADLDALSEPPEIPTRMGWDAVLAFAPGLRARTGADPMSVSGEVAAHPAPSSATGDGAYEIEAKVWLARPWPLTEAVPIEELLIRRLQAFVDQQDCSFACISDDLHGGLPLEDAQRRGARHAHGESKQFLRNYSWVTYCSPELTQKLDLAPTSSTAFPRISLRASGGSMLQFTPHLQDFTGDNVRTAAALLAGAIAPRPTTFQKRDSSYRLLWSDGRAGPLPYDSPSSQHS